MRKISDILEDFRQFPETDIAGLLGGLRPLIIAPHPDDESLGCGGLIAASCDAGVAPVVVVLTDGAGSHPGSRAYPPERLLELREQEAKRAVNVLGLPLRNLYFLRAPDTKLPEAGQVFDDHVSRLGEIGRSHDCGAVVAPWLGDPHCDHQAAAIMATNVSVEHDWALLSYPVWGWLREGEDLFDEPRKRGWKLQISGQMPRKQQAIAAHRSQYGGLIEDSLAGFKLPDELLRVFSQNFEIYIT
jgi:LmbE family N-acetylglucosaminyl deacetylase